MVAASVSRAAFPLDLERNDLSTPLGRFRVERRGERPRAVFLHGFAGEGALWDPVWVRLPADWALARYDLRGFGATAAPCDEPYDHAADLEAILDALGIARTALVGHSLGGAVALRFALDHPERVERLALLSPALVGWEWSPAWQARWEAIRARARAGDLEGAKVLWWTHPLFHGLRNKPTARLARAALARYGGGHWMGDAARPAMPDLERLPGLACPTLLLAGGADLPEFHLIADAVAALAPRVRREDLPGVGHGLPLEAPDAVADHLAAFLAEGPQ